MANKGGNITTSGTGLKAGITGVDVLNALRSSLPSQYQTRIPVATRETLAEYGNALRDYPVIMGVCLLSAIVVLVANLVTDILYVILNPTIKLQ